MILRDHPLIIYRGLRSWPPMWAGAEPRIALKTVSGEIGRLKYVLRGKTSDRFYLVVEHEGHSYVGCVLVEDRVFCAQIMAFIQKQTGLTVKEIGDLDFSCTL